MTTVIHLSPKQSGEYISKQLGGRGNSFNYFKSKAQSKGFGFKLGKELVLQGTNRFYSTKGLDRLVKFLKKKGLTEYAVPSVREYLSKAECIQIYGLPKNDNSFKNWIADCKITVWQKGRRFKYSRKDIEAAIKSQTHKAGSYEEALAKAS